MNFVRYIEPVNQAFVAEVPEGWEVQGACQRVALGDIRLYLRLRSPEGIVVQFRDPTISSLYIHADGRQVRPGQQVPLPTRAQLLAIAYPPGAQFVRGYVEQQIGPSVAGLTWNGLQDRPDFARPRFVAPGAPGVQFHAGQGSFSGVRGERPWVGDCVAVTLFQPGVISFWGVDSMLTFLTPQEMQDTVRTVAGCLWQTLAPTPAFTQLVARDEQELAAHGQAAHAAQWQWFGAQQQAHRAQQAFLDSLNQNYWDQQAHNERMHQSYWDQQATYDRISQNSSDATLDRQRLYDPVLDEYKEASGGFDYYWRVNSTGEIVGTNTADPPTLQMDVTPLKKKM